MAELPSGTVTFLFTDIEGSTRLWEQFPDAMRDALARHDQLLRDAIEARDGYVVKTTGDGFHAAFGTADAGVIAAVAAQRALDDEAWPVPVPLLVRMGLHTGVASSRDGDYFGSSLNRAARLMGVAHGGQVVCSQATADLAREVLDDGVDFVDLGEHRLRDLSRAERVFQVCSPGLATEFAALSSVDAFPGNLPLQLSSFVGREREIARTVEALTSSRIVTLTGVGGVGKTRLALQVAAEVLPQFREGAWLVELAPVRDPAGVVDAFAADFGVSARAGQTLTEAMVEFLGTKQLLLVVDNCEHVLDPVADLLDEVSRSCPGVVVLATSREGLALDGERVVPVPSLRGPEVTDDLAVVAGSEAVQLFLDRAAAVDPEFVLDAATVQGVVQVCRRLDGVPLAIELAAAQVPMMSPAELGRALDQRFDVLAGGRRGGIERHQTLRATIDWSYEMLDEAQRRLWARLAVFAGGCTRDAVEAVCVGGPVEERAVLALVRDLVARSLVAAERGGNATRYRLLETIRAYGEERIVEHGETDALRDRHAAYYADLARRCGQGLEGPERMEWGARMSADSENMLAAFAHAIDTGNLDLVVMLLESTPPNSPQTGYQLSFPVDSVLSTPGVEHHPGFPLVLMAAAAAANLRGETKIAREYGDAALERERASTARRPYTLDLEAARCFLEGLIASSERSWEDAAVAWLEAAEIYRRGGKLGQAATSLGSAASAFSFGGRFADALPLATEALALLRATSTPTMANVTLMGALAMAVSPQDPTRARALLDEIQGDPAAENYGEATQLTLAAAVIGEWSLAARFATRSIPLLHWVNHRPYLQIVLTLAARILAPTDPESAATIQGAARALIVPVDSASTDERRGESTPGGAEGGVGLLADAARDTTRLLTDALGRERLRELRGRGAALGTDTAVAYTLSRLDVFLTHAG